jgi:hypothetical protein
MLLARGFELPHLLAETLHLREVHLSTVEPVSLEVKVTELLL